MKKIIAICFILLGFVNLYSQDDSPNVSPNDKVFTIVQQQPKFPGDINKWLVDNINYPQQAKVDNVQGTVYISFIVEEDGSVSNVKVLRGVSSYLDNEGVRVVSMMPKWTPGMQNNQAVRVQYNVPIRFSLRGGSSDNGNNIPIKDNNEVYDNPQMTPKFPGDVNNYLTRNLVYPSDARKSNIQGTVYISFIVEKNGSVSNAIVFKGVDGGESLNKEALRVVSMMPNWTPGMQNGQMVRTKYMLPVQFELNGSASQPEKNNVNKGTQSVADPDGVTIQVDQKPEFHGNLLSFLAANLHYPEQSKANKIEGTVYTSFVVGTDGIVSAAKVEKSGGGREDMEKEAIRLIYAMPNWKPAMLNGQPVAVRLYLSIPFFIDMNEE